MLSASLLLAAPTPPTPVVPATIVAASLFKNGYAVVTREIVVDGKRAAVAELPRGSLGTVWFTTADGRPSLRRIVTTTEETSGEAPVASLEDVIRANVGRRVSLNVVRPKGDEYSVEGEILSAEGTVVVVRTNAGVVAVNKAGVTKVESAGGDLVWKLPTKESRRLLRIETDGPTKVRLVALERGLTWSPAYAVQLAEGGKTLTLTAKATIVNDLGEIQGREVRLVTGFPNVPFAQFLDPLLSGQGVDEFTNMLNGLGQEPALGRRREMMTQNAYMESARMAPNLEAMPTSPLAGEQREDLFFYRLPDVSLKAGDRGYYALFQAKADYEDVYCWDIADSTVNNLEYRGIPDEPGDVWHAISFKNTAPQPLTTAPATIFQGGEVIGQAQTSYVPVGAPAELRISKALDVRAEGKEQEVSRERAAIKRSDGYPLFDLLTVEGRLSIKNFKRTAVKMRVTKDLTGEIVTNEGGAEVTKTAKGLRETNPVSRLVWTKEIPAGGSVDLAYVYKLYLRTQN